MRKMLFLAALTAAAVNAGEIKIDGSTTVGPIVKAFAEAFMKQNKSVNISVSESGSGNGAKSLGNKACDIAMLSRPLKETEFKAAAEKGIQPMAAVVAYDAIVMIVHPSNPVKNLTLEQIAKIYAGEIKNWKDVGGADSEIVAVTRDSNSGTFESFNHLVMGKAKIAASAEVVGSNGAARQRVQTTKGAVAFVGIGYLDKSVKGLNVEGVEPAPETVVSGEYKISRPLFIFTDGAPAMGSELFRFVNFYLTKDGQKIVEETGFVPVTQY